MYFSGKAKKIVVLVFALIFAMSSFTMYAEAQGTTSYSQILGDCNNDGKVTIDDLVITALRYGAQRGDARYDYEADVSHDGNINSVDIDMIKQNYRKLNPSTVPVIAVAGQDFVTYKRFNAALDSSQSYIEAGRTVSYDWHIIEKPQGSSAILNGETSSNPTFAPDVTGIYKIGLIMNDGQYYSRESVVTVTVKELGDTTDTMDISSIGNGKHITSSYDYTDMISLSDGWVIAKDKTNKKVVFYNVLMGMTGKEYSTSLGVPNRMEIDYTRNVLYVTLEGVNQIAKINLSTDEITYMSLSWPAAEIALGEKGILFVLANDGSYIYLQALDTETQAVLSSIKQTVSYKLMAYDKFGNNVILGETGSSPSRLKSYAFNDEEFFLKPIKELSNAGGNAQDLTISNDGMHVAFPCGGGNGTGYTIHDIRSSDIAQYTGEWNTGAYPTSARFSLDDKYFVASNGSSLKIFDRATYALIKSITRISSDSYDKVNISRGGKLLFDAVGQKLDIYQSGIVQDNVTPPVVNSKPIALAGRDKITLENFNVQLDGSKSRVMAEGHSLTYNWTIESKPAGSQAALVNANTSKPSFVPDLLGDYRIALAVNNGIEDSDVKYVNVKVKDIASTTDDISQAMISSLPADTASGFADVKPVALTDGWMIAADTSNNIQIINVLSGDVAKKYSLGVLPTSIDFDFEQKRILATLTNTSKIAVINVLNDNIRYITTPTTYTGITYGEANVAFAISSSEVSVVDLTLGTVPQRLTESTYKANLIEYDKNNNNLIFAEKGLSPSSLCRYSYDAATKKLRKIQELGYGSNGTDLTMSNDGLHIAFSCGGGNSSGYTLFDISSADISVKFGQWAPGAYPTSAVFTNDNRYVIASNRTNLKLFDVAAHTFVQDISSAYSSSSTGKLLISRGDKLIYDMSNNVVRFLYNSWTIQQ